MEWICGFVLKWGLTTADNSIRWDSRRIGLKMKRPTNKEKIARYESLFHSINNAATACRDDLISKYVKQIDRVILTGWETECCQSQSKIN